MRNRSGSWSGRHAVSDHAVYGRPRDKKVGVPNGIRTRVLALKGPRPGPLDDGDAMTGTSNHTILPRRAFATQTPVRPWRIIAARDVLKDQENGEIRVATELAESGREIIITIEDNGTGIPQENLSKIFTPFFTTKERGTGLGLSICYETINQHGGTIQVHSEMGRGTTFTILLPIEST